MAKDPEKYRLWQHEVEPPKKSERTVIAKVTPAATPSRAGATALSARGRAASAAGVTPDSGMARLLDNAHVTSIKNVFDEEPGRWSRRGHVRGGALAAAGRPRAGRLGSWRSRLPEERARRSSPRTSRACMTSSMRSYRRCAGCSPGARSRRRIRSPRGNGVTARFASVTRATRRDSRTRRTSRSPWSTAGSTCSTPT